MYSNIAEISIPNKTITIPNIIIIKGKNITIFFKFMFKNKLTIPSANLLIVDVLSIFTLILTKDNTVTNMM